METLVDIEVLALRCLSETSKDYIRGAVVCYRSGAFRAAIVTTWVAVVFDLIDKIKELALSGDAKAKTIERQYETYLQQIDQGNPQGIKSALEFERDLLSLCKVQLDLFDSQQFLDLTRLREDRHRCAHPSFQRAGEPYRPSAEQARLHLRNAVACVLSLPPVQGKAALSELMRLVASAYFPADVPRAAEQFRNSPLRRPTDALIRGFVDALLSGYCDPGSPFLHRSGVVVALNALLQDHRGVAETRLSRQLNKLIRDLPDASMLSPVKLVGCVTSAWTLLEASSRDKVVEFIRRGDPASLVQILAPLATIDALRPEVEARIHEFKFEDLAKGIEEYGLSALGKERALDLLSQSRSWNKVNDVMDRSVLPLFETLTKADIERIIRMPVQTGADLPGAGGFTKLIARVRLTTMFQPDELDGLLSDNKAGYLVQTP